ncbi:MAG TPA: LamG-like jellyroll fold domain-containing protein [Aridibacter sp.]|nr:LamG-like jellyroll fold domain-containing protein [Aridibacter sp.]
MSDNRFSNGIARNFTQAAYPNLWRGLVGAFDARAGVQGFGLKNLAIGRGEFCELKRDLDLWEAHGYGIKGYIDLGTDSTHQVRMESKMTVAPTDPLGLGGKNGTIMVRVRLDSIASFNGLVSKVDGNSSANGYNFLLDGAAPPKISLGMAGATSLSASSSTPVQEWFTAAAAWDGTTWRIYLNGALDNSAARTNRPPSGNTTNFALGTLAHAISNDMLGLFQYAYLWNRCLRPSEIMQVHAGASPLIKKNEDDQYHSLPFERPVPIDGMFFGAI